MQDTKVPCWPCKLGRNVRLLVLGLSLILYILLGSLIFSSMESAEERIDIENLRRIRAAFASKISQCVSDAELEEFIVTIIDADDGGVPAFNNVTYEPNWSFGQSVFFVGTLLTTVGYGHNRPLTHSGKVFCIFYVLVGLPLTLIFLTAAVHRLMIPAGWLLALLQRKMEYVTKELHIRLIHLLIIITILFTGFFIIPAIIFSSIEPEWDFMDGLYYCFISLTTIGLGDYIPGEHQDQKERAIYKIGVTVYLYLGLMCMMTMLAVTYNIKELNLTNHFILEVNSKDEEKEKLTTNLDQPATKYTTDEERQDLQSGSEDQ